MASRFQRRISKEASFRGGRTRLALETQSFLAYRSVCLWLGHFYAVVTLWRWLFMAPALHRQVLALESLVLMGVFYASGLLIHPLAEFLGGLENVGLFLIGVSLGQDVFLVAWLPKEVQLVNFILVQVCAAVAFRATWRFVLSQALCLGLAVLSMTHWVGPSVLGGDFFILLSGLLISTMIWLFLNRLLQSLSSLRRKDLLLLRQRTRLVRELRTALVNVRTLRGLIPICAHCKRVRDDTGFWQQVESYVRDRSEAKFTHGICPECREGVQAELEEMKTTWKPER